MSFPISPPAVEQGVCLISREHAINLLRAYQVERTTFIDRVLIDGEPHLAGRIGQRRPTDTAEQVETVARRFYSNRAAVANRRPTTFQAPFSYRAVMLKTLVETASLLFSQAEKNHTSSSCAASAPPFPAPPCRRKCRRPPNRHGPHFPRHGCHLTSHVQPPDKRQTPRPAFRRAVARIS